MPSVGSAWRQAHCGGGTGPNQFNALAALERWLEQNEPPKSITAARELTGNALSFRSACAKLRADGRQLGERLSLNSSREVPSRQVDGKTSRLADVDRRGLEAPSRETTDAMPTSGD
jgi:hypothetical protein